MISVDRWLIEQIIQHHLIRILLNRQLFCLRVSRILFTTKTPLGLLSSTISLNLENLLFLCSFLTHQNPPTSICNLTNRSLFSILYFTEDGAQTSHTEHRCVSSCRGTFVTENPIWSAWYYFLKFFHWFVFELSLLIIWFSNSFFHMIVEISCLILIL